MKTELGKMLAAVAHKGEYKLRLEYVDVPAIDDDDVLVKVKAVGITRGLMAMWHFTDMIKLMPSILGHAIAGEVALLGSRVDSFQEGERVRVHAMLSCGACTYCRTDRENYCPFQCTIGGAAVYEAGMPLYERYHNGGMAQYVKVPATSLHRIPDNISHEEAVLVGVLAGSFRTLRLAGGTFGDTLVITGASGSSGAAATRCAPLLGYTTIYGVATNRPGLERLLGPGGLTHFIATSELPDDWEERGLLTAALREAADDDGIDAVIDFMPFGREVTMQAIRSLRPGGSAVLSGGNISELNLSYLEVMRNQYQIKGVRGNVRRDEQEIMKLLSAGRIKVADLVTHVFPLEEVNCALNIVMGREGSPVYLILKP